MRRVGFVLAVLAAILSGACDTTQPSKGGNSTASVQVEARGNVAIVDCYDRYNNGVFDRVVCFEALGTELSTRQVPWRYSFRVAILRAGETFPEVLAGSINNGGTFPTFGCAAQFDPQVAAAPIRLDEPPYSFQNPRRVSQGSRDYFLANNIPLPEPNILGVLPSDATSSPRYDIELEPGDAIIVEAAKQAIVQGPPIFPPLDQTQPRIDPSLRISGRLFLAGSEITPAAGTVESSSADKSGFSFNYISD